jgi:hypothetical protein
MVFEHLKIWQEDFWFQSFFLFRYSIKAIAEKMADSPSPKSSSE